MLTSRMKNTINSILASDGFITLKQISESQGVSTRTLLRELDDVAHWVSVNEGIFVKKKGRGIMIEGDAEERLRLTRLLNSEKGALIYTPEDRSVIIRAEMLGATEPMKLFTLTQLMDVTESTVANDLQQLEEWFDSYGIRVVKRPGLGILLDGDEKALRKAVVSLIYEQVDTVEFMDFIKESRIRRLDIESIRSHINDSIYKLLDSEGITEGRELLNYIEKEMGYHIADNAFVALVIRMSITMARVGQWGRQLINYEYRDRIKSDKIFRIIRGYVEEDGDSIFAALPEEELLYLTMHIKGAKLRETTSDNKISMVEDFRTVQLVKDFILAVESETGIYLADNEALMVGLVKHLRPAIFRMKMDLDIINPLLSEIKDMYPKLFVAISNCKHIIENKEKVTVPDDEIAYLATHIGAVIQKDHREVVKKFQVVLACMYGIGASQLLVANIEKNFRNIEITKVISIMDYKLNPVDFRDVDLVISTVPIEDADIPCIVVNPLLKQDDIMSISAFLKAFTPSQKTLAARKNIKLKEKLSVLSQYSGVITDILEHYSFETEVEAATMNEVILYASGLLSVNGEENNRLIKAFEAREEKGSTILSKKGMLLLHCRADIRHRVCLKIIGLKEPIEIRGNGQMIATIVVMVGPQTLDQKILDVLSEISRCIITSELSDAMIDGKTASVEAQLNSVLDKYFENQVLSM